MLYKTTGVDIDKANLFVRKIKKLAPKIGGFSGIFSIDTKKFKDPVIAATTDGIGTKLKIAQLVNKHDTVGIDLVAMCVNDLITCGAEPLFFLDYFATGKLNLKVAEEIIEGINKGCKLANCILLGGETAEMPGFYPGGRYGEYDLAGFAVGIVEKANVIDGKRIAPGDVLIGLKSSGLHSNGFSLVRKVLSVVEQKKLAGILLTPTKIYVKDILKLITYCSQDSHYIQRTVGGCGTRQASLINAIHGICHITGGGFYDNIIRILPSGCQAVIHKNSWDVPVIFKMIQSKGKVPEGEMYRVFNMGIGMVVIVSESASSTVKNLLKDSIVIGEIVRCKSGKAVKII
ncbi:MAG: phosphoribosylformylglycinamidine cyclo-ligase [Elusimicrobiota bacterium]|nr:phosphoribosylformylglycinamidine cyclo-ligase [Elusimicrobiota bacterium]